MKVRHLRYKAIRCPTLSNNDLERHHGTFREFDKIRRGFEKQHTAQANIDGFRTFYNYIREHTELGMTPAEKAGIDLELREDKWMNLLKRSVSG